MSKKKSWTLDVQEIDGEFFIEFPDEVLEGTGWKIGDAINWVDNKDGSWTLTKSDKVWVMVECVSMFRERYLVEAPADHPEYALDTVTMNEAKEFSQEHIGETIVSHRVVSYDEALKQCDVDNSYVQGWTEEQKVKCFFTKEGETNES
jgi:hypothetical protein